MNESVLPPFEFVTDKRINNVLIRNNEILKRIRNLNPNKATGSDGISGLMLLFCDESVVLPLKIISQNIFHFPKFKILSFYFWELFQKNNNLGNFFKNVLRAVSTILGGGIMYSPTPYTMLKIKKILQNRGWN